MAESVDPAIPRRAGSASRSGPAGSDLSPAGLELDGVRFPHCDQRVLHAPSECTYCDMFPIWQELRDNWGIAFTGHAAPAGGLPCPADHARPPGGPSDHRNWPGNRAVVPGSAPSPTATYVTEPPRDEAGRVIARYGDADSGMLRRLARGMRRPGRWWP